MCIKDECSASGVCVDGQNAVGSSASGAIFVGSSVSQGERHEQGRPVILCIFTMWMLQICEEACTKLQQATCFSLRLLSTMFCKGH